MATVTFKITGGEVIPEIEMPVSATILDLKEKIESLLDVSVARQTLRFNNQVLINDRKIDRYNFGTFVALVLIVSPLAGHPKFKISVKSTFDVSSVRVKETTLVADLKKELQNRGFDYSRTKMTLYRLSKKMDDDLPLSAYYVSEGSEIEVKF